MDVVEFVVNRGNGVCGLAKSGLKTVPDIYVQPVEERFDSSNTSVKSGHLIPVIDISNIENDPEIGEKVCNAARKYGFFQIVNHGVPEDILEAVQGAGRRFFAQPTEEKVSYKAKSVSRGTVTFGTSFIPGDEKVLEWKDFLDLRYVSDEDASKEWPPICKDESLEYRKRVSLVGKKIYNALLRGLNIEWWNDEARRSVLIGTRTVHFNYYPPCPNPELTVGISRHTDATCITILLQDDVGGLYARAENDAEESWIYIPPLKGALVINIGDCMEVLSNGQYKSIEHRVVVNADKPRLSLAVFISPLPSYALSPLSEILAAEETPLYKEVMYGDYLKYVVSKRHGGKVKIDSLKI